MAPRAPTTVQLPCSEKCLIQFMNTHCWRGVPRKRMFAQSILSANTIRDGYLPKKGWEGGGGRQSKTSVLATIFHREGIVAMAGRVEVGFN